MYPSDKVTIYMELNFLALALLLYFFGKTNRKRTQQGNSEVNSSDATLP